MFIVVGTFMLMIRVERKAIMPTLTKRSMWRFNTMLKAGLILLFSSGLFISGSNGATGKASVRVPVGANVSSTVTSRSRAFQDSLMHRQDYVTSTESSQYTIEYNNYIGISVVLCVSMSERQ